MSRAMADDLIERSPWLCECEGVDDDCMNCALHRVSLEVEQRNAELERLRAGIRAEIDWHENEAKWHRDAAADFPAGDEEGQMHNIEVAVHDTAATRLRALLPQPTPEPEGK